jgi:O-antigen/teichoic acid export membrane protein
MSNKLVKNTIYYSLGEIIPRIISFVLLPILTTYLTPSEYGITMYTNSVMMFVFVIASLSLNTFLLKNYYTQKDEDSRRELIGSVFLFVFIFNVLIVVLQVLFFPFIIDFFKINVPFKPFFLLAIFNNFFDVISLVPLVLFRVREDARGFLIMSLSRTILQFILIYVLVVIFKQGLEGSYYGRLYVNIPFVFIYFYYIKQNAKLKINTKLIRQALLFSLPLLPGGLSYLLITLSDRIILERFVSLDKIGIYSVATTLALVLNIVIQAFYKTFEPMLFKEYLNENFQETNLKLYKIYLFALFVGAFAASFFSKEFFLIATSGAFREAYEIVPFLIISVVISGINTYLNVLMIACDRQKMTSVILILSAIISVILNFVFIPYFGFYGAITASVSSFLFVNVILQYNVTINKKFFVVQLILMFIIIVSPFVFDKYVTLNLLLTLFVKSIVLSFFCIIALKSFDISVNQIFENFLKPKVVKET